MEKSDSIAALAAALAKAQGAFLPVKRSVKVDFASSSGPRVKYNYAPLSEVLEACRAALSANGLAIMQPTRMQDGTLIVETLLCHTSGEWIKSEIIIEGQGKTPQSEGSALTYARRYALSSLLGIASEEDDDGEAAQGRPGATPSTTEATPGTPASENWCSEHNTEWFMKGKMKAYAHPIEGSKDWCHKPKATPTKQPGQSRANQEQVEKDTSDLFDQRSNTASPSPSGDVNPPLNTQGQSKAGPGAQMPLLTDWTVTTEAIFGLPSNKDKIQIDVINQIFGFASKRLGKPVTKWGDIGQDKKAFELAWQIAQEIRDSKWD